MLAMLANIAIYLGKTRMFEGRQVANMAFLKIKGAKNAMFAKNAKNISSLEGRHGRKRYRGR